MEHQLILVMDFGGQYTELLARRVRDMGVYSVVKPYHISSAEVMALAPSGILLTGGPASLADAGAPRCDPGIFALGIPILGICYGAQLMGEVLGGTVDCPAVREYGKKEITYGSNSILFKGLPSERIVWMSHTVAVSRLPERFVCTASTDSCANAAFEDAAKGLYGVQFHPEVTHTQGGQTILRNFVFDICHCIGDWQIGDMVEEMVARIRSQVGSRSVLCALSGGVDSAVAAVLVNRAVGKQLTCMFVDTGLMRKNEGKEVEQAFTRQFDIRFIRIDAEQRFLDRLVGVTDPERKRKIIGEEFIRVFEDEGRKLGSFGCLVQGTIYPDIIESGLGSTDLIKSHHNVGGLPDVIDFEELVEPLKMLFKDEVRKLGEALGIPEHLVWRQPFPGPGLGIRVIGEITKPKLDLLREADAIFREEIAVAGLVRQVSQYFAVLTDLRSVGVMGDERTYDYTVALRAVTTTDFMTADWAKIPHEVLARCSCRIVNEVRQINRVVYDITGKPPATIEWE